MPKSGLNVALKGLDAYVDVYYNVKAPAAGKHQLRGSFTLRRLRLRGARRNQ